MTEGNLTLASVMPKKPVSVRFAPETLCISPSMLCNSDTLISDSRITTNLAGEDEEDEDEDEDEDW